ncbi:DUF4926 domain-containing protein [Kovacikia minuta CCNUW1]|uniref:DUF4926 domain-containing protein n=1 Tax=Kovacikia minuta TaxID=2931930 RepID=UPI001CCC5C82|nr:DUF4926 domain-containing protein [Kovacikia minuta]UBF24580.1 DUF4926 domain-containing protein [Kovacikia minuta CCNUW1]
MTQPKLLDAIALLHDLPVERLTLVEPEYASVKTLPSGLIGTVVEVYESKQGYHYLVEFADSQGCEYAMATLQANELLVLQPELIVA